MAKKAKDKNNANLDEKIQKNKKKMTILIVGIAIACISIGGVIGFSLFQKNSAKKVAEEQELALKPLKDILVEKDTENTIYSRDIKKQTYMLRNGALQFEGTLIFYNKLCANLYTGISDRKEMEKTEPDLTVENDVIGDKIIKDALNKYLQENPKEKLSTSTDLASGLQDAINKQFLETFGHEIVKNILITSHIIQ